MVIFPVNSKLNDQKVLASQGDRLFCSEQVSQAWISLRGPGVVLTLPKAQVWRITWSSQQVLSAGWQTHRHRLPPVITSLTFYLKIHAYSFRTSVLAFMSNSVTSKKKLLQNEVLHFSAQDAFVKCIIFILLRYTDVPESCSRGNNSLEPTLPFSLFSARIVYSGTQKTLHNG